MLSCLRTGGLAAGLFVFILLCLGCSQHNHAPSFSEEELPTEIFLSEVPFYPQKKYQCGPASLAMLLEWSGIPVQPEDLTAEVFSPMLHGSLQPSLIAAARKYGRIAYPIAGPEELFVELQAGHPVIILQNLGFSWLPRWHYAVVVGYKRDGDDIILHSGDTAAEHLDWRTFNNTWGRSDYWGLLVLPPGKMPATAREEQYLAAVSGLERAGRFESALKGYRCALEKWPLSLGAMMGIGNSHYAMGAFTEAAAAFQRAAAAYPENGMPYNNLAQTLLIRGDTDNARKAARRAVELGGPLIGTFEETLQEIEQTLQ